MKEKTVQLTKETLAKLPEGTLPGKHSLVLTGDVYGIDVGDVVVKIPEFTPKVFKGMSVFNVEFDIEGKATLVPLSAVMSSVGKRTSSVPSWQAKASF